MVSVTLDTPGSTPKSPTNGASNGCAECGFGPVSQQLFVTVDGNEAAAAVAYAASEVIAIYPITPASTMGELADHWSSRGRTNIFGSVPDVVEMQSEGGAAAAVHGALQSGALSTTFTASQGLLLMLPDMFKIAGELLPAVVHVAARTVATHALSIFGDHSDVMAARTTGWALLSSTSPQEAQDFALIAHAATLRSRVPFVHFFDGFRTSHEVNKIKLLGRDAVRAMIDQELVEQHRARALNPDQPVLRGSAQNPDVFFQSREAANPFYLAVPRIVQETMDEFARLAGRSYRLFDYFGSPDAREVIVVMGSGAWAVEEAAAELNKRGAKVGVLIVRLYRPLDGEALIEALPKTVERIAVLDRTKEPGALGEPLYLDVVAALAEHWPVGAAATALPLVIGGRYGLSSKEFTPAMALAVFEHMKEPPAQLKRHFTVGIYDDVTRLSLAFDPAAISEPDDVARAVFFGLGSDGTVGASKNSVKIIGANTELYAQGYFVYDSKKSGSTTVSHLRFSPRPIRAPYLIDRATFVACHHFHLMEQRDVLEAAAPGATFLLNSPYAVDHVWDLLPREAQQQIIDKRLRFFVVDGYAVARQAGMGSRINTAMQACFFALAGVLPRDEALEHVKTAIRKTYGQRGDAVVAQNFAAIEGALASLAEVSVPAEATAQKRLHPAVAEAAPDIVQRVIAAIVAGRGDYLPVSAMPVDGTFPTGTARFEKRSIAAEVPIWDANLCTDCGLCALVCPHAAIRLKAFPAAALADAPAGFASKAWREKGYDDYRLTVQLAPDDCTGCSVCVEVCPAKSKEVAGHKAIDMRPKGDHLVRERENFAYFQDIPPLERTLAKIDSIKGSQLLEPLFEFSGACAGCGETPYLKLMSQLFGDRAVIANATGCSSIYGGNLPTTPWTKNCDGRGPAWCNSLFEDNGEFGFGLRLGIDAQRQYAEQLLKGLSERVGAGLVEELLAADQTDETGIALQRNRVAALKVHLAHLAEPEGASWPASPTRWSSGACGSWAETVGPTTSASAGWIMSCRSIETSTCLCSTPGCIPTPAVSRPRRPPEPPSPSLPPTARLPARRIWACWPYRTEACTSPKSL